MKNYLYKIAPIVVFVALLLPSLADAAQFEVPLGPGASNPKAEVTKLQQFLFQKGFLKVAPTGNYLSLTIQAVKDFQQSQNIETTGFFGPLSRAAANKVFAGAVVPSGISSFTVSPLEGAAGAFLSDSKEIKWQTKDYPAAVGVNINLLRKVSTNPESFELVRQIAKDTPNDGYELWVKTAQDGNTSDLYIEVTCSTTYKFEGECRFLGKAIKVF